MGNCSGRKKIPTGTNPDNINLPDLVKHYCVLPSEEDPVCMYINSGYFVDFRRKWKKTTVVYDKHPKSREVLKSTRSIQYEKKRHLQYFYSTLHPFSIIRVYYEFVFMFTMLITLMIYPIETCVREYKVFEVAKLILDCCFLFDVFLTFFTGYFDPKTSKIVLRKKKIALHYFANLFVFDTISSINPHVISKFMKFQHQKAYYMKLFNFFKILRLPTVLLYLDRFKEWRQYSTYKFKVFKLSYVGLGFSLWTACLLYYISLYTEEAFLVEIENHTEINGFLICYCRVIQLILLVGNGTVPGSSAIILSFEIMCVICGSVLWVYTLSQILKIVNKYNSAGNKYFQLTQGLQEYAAYMKLPDGLTKSIIEYFDFKFQKIFFKENEIMTTISEQLKNAIVLHRSKNLLDKVQIFNDLPPSLLVSIVVSMKSSIYLPGDVIVQAGTEGDSMFFIITGTVAIYTNFGKEVCHLADGAHFGEIALVMPGEKRVASVIAVDPCELFSLNRKDFQKAIQPYPDLYFRIRKLAQTRLTRTMDAMAKEQEKRRSTGEGRMKLTSDKPSVGKRDSTRASKGMAI